jgi:hypothetical protein
VYGFSPLLPLNGARAALRAFSITCSLTFGLAESDLT